MVFNLQFGVLGEEQIDRTLVSYSEALEDMRPAWDQLADRFEKAERKQFDTQGAYSGDAWSPLSPNYAAWKQKHYGTMPIMQREQRLYEQLTSQPFGVDVREMNYALYGTALPYAVFHQKGKGNNPQRRIVSLTSYERRAWVKVIQGYLHEAMKERIASSFPLKKMVVKKK